MFPCCLRGRLHKKRVKEIMQFRQRLHGETGHLA